MTSSKWPKITPSQLSGEVGTALVTSHFLSEFGWILRRTHQEHDFGIDGEVELITAQGEITGRVFAVQIKHGSSYFNERTPSGFLYRGETRHLNYYLNYPMPVLLILSNPDTHEIYWVQFSLDRTTKSGVGWTIEVPSFQCLLSNARTQLEAIAGPPQDFSLVAESHWKMNETLRSASIVGFAVDRKDVETQDVSPTVNLFNRLQVSNQLARSMQGKIDLFFVGYDEDPREVWEIPEVRQWIVKIDPLVKYWFFFLTTYSRAAGIKLLLASLCTPEKSSEPQQIYIEAKENAEWLRENFIRLNEITEKLGVSEEENKRISGEIMRYLHPDFDLF